MYTLSERPDLAGPAQDMIPLAWPEFMLEDPVASQYWGDLIDLFPAFQQVYCNDEGQVVAYGNSIPVGWDLTRKGLPGGWDEVLSQGIQDHGKHAPNAVSALSATIHPDYQGKGLSKLVIEGMKTAASDRSAHGLDLQALIAPVRPSLKSSYPLIPIETYIGWKDAHGLPFDPWLRVHARLGAMMLAVAAASMVIPGSVQEWETWTGMRFPGDGQYVVPGALVPVSISLKQNLGLYVEPNVWMVHSLG